MPSHKPYRTSEYDETLRSFDPDIHGVTIINESQRLAHDGFVFHVSGRIPAVANGGIVRVLMKTPPTQEIHWSRAEFSFARGDWDIDTFENTIVSADGTPLTAVRNINRTSDNTPDLTMFSSPTIVDPGTVLHELWAVPTGSGVGNSIGISDVKNGEEWVMKPNTNYMVRLTNNSGGSARLSYEFLWFEANYQL